MQIPETEIQEPEIYFSNTSYTLGYALLPIGYYCDGKVLLL